MAESTVPYNDTALPSSEYHRNDTQYITGYILRTVHES